MSLAINTPEWVKQAQCLNNSCKGGEFLFEGKPLYARRLTTVQSVALRMLMLKGAQTVVNEVDVRTGIVDGAKIRLERQVKDIPQGGSKYDCGHFPQAATKDRVIERYVILAKLFFHKDICLATAIGSAHQDGSCGEAQLISGGPSLHDIKRDDQFIIDKILMKEDIDMAFAVDAHNLYGNKTNILSPQSSANVVYKEYDGWITQLLKASEAKSFHTIEWDLPVVAAGGSYFFEYGGQVRNTLDDGTLVDDAFKLAQALNEHRNNITDKPLFSAGVVNGMLRVTALSPVEDLLRTKGLKIYYAEDSMYDACADALVGVVLSEYSEIAQTPYLKEFTEPTKDTILDYLIATMCEIRDHVRSCMPDEYMIPMGHFMFIDPHWLDWMKVAKIIDSKGNCCSAEYEERYDGFMPKFIPIDALAGKNLWLWSVPKNLLFFANTINVAGNTVTLSDKRRGYNEECEKIWTKNDILVGANIFDMCLVASNACNSPLHKNLVYGNNDRLPHIVCPARPDACPTDNTGLNAEPMVCKTPVDPSDPTQGFVITIDGSESEGAQEYNWTIATTEAGTTIDPIKAESGEFTVTMAEYINIASVTLTVTGAGSNTNSETIPVSEIGNCEGC